MAGSQRTGKIRIKTDGKILDSLPGAKINLGGEERTPVVGSNAVLGFSAKPKESMVECQVSLGKGQKLEDFRKITDATLTAETDTGQMYVIAHAFLTEPPSLTDDQGKVDLKFAGQPAEEVA